VVSLSTVQCQQLCPTTSFPHLTGLSPATSCDVSVGASFLECTYAYNSCGDASTQQVRVHSAK
jgi:hypothetical protein